MHEIGAVNKGCVHMFRLKKETPRGPRGARIAQFRWKLKVTTGVRGCVFCCGVTKERSGQARWFLSSKHHEFAKEEKGTRIYNARKDLTDIGVNEKEGRFEGRQVCKIGE
jgi:hypothetical protein